MYPFSHLSGLRDPHNFWDFFDTPDADNVHDRASTVGDIFRVVDRFGASGIPGDPLSAPPSGGYHAAFDRSSPPGGGEPWDLGRPVGAITVGDFFAAIAQFGHSFA